MAADPELAATAKPRRWTIAAVFGSAAVASLIALVALAARWWPALAIHWAPAPWALAVVGWSADSRVDAAVAAANERSVDVDAAAAALDARPGRWARRGAWRVIGGGAGPWCDADCGWRDALAPWLSGRDAVLRVTARTTYRRITHDDEALRWLRAQQRPDGSWAGAATAIAPGYVPGDVGATALATLAFLGAGYDHRMPSKQKRVVARALDHLLAIAGPDGRLAEDPRDQALAAMALSEAFAISNDRALREPARRATARCGAALSGPRLSDDALEIELDVAALKSAQASGIFDRDAFVAAAALVRSAWTSTAAVAAAWRGTAAGAAVADADAAAVRGITAVWMHGPAAAAGSAAEIAGRGDIDAWSPFMLDRATLLVFQEDHAWAGWAGRVRDALWDRQRLGDTATEGSWDPPSGDERDRVAVTACHTLTLEIYYRYSAPTPSPKR